MAEYLGSRGFKVYTADNGEVGLARLRGAGIDAVVLDVMLAGADGFEVLRELRRDSTVPVVMLTVRGDDFDRIVGLELGADDYLAKPSNPRELLARIQVILCRVGPDLAANSAVVAGPIRVDPTRAR